MSHPSPYVHRWPRARGGSEALVADCVSGVPAAHALGAAMGELARALQHEHASSSARWPGRSPAMPLCW